MKKLMRAMKGIGKVFLAILGCLLMPVLIWVALGVALYQKTIAARAETKPVPTFRQILTDTGFYKK
ncbi:MAG: hypothetical protein PHR56_03770 [Dehalococcoidales bacterium]|nr:hypothetical protein [Dehalococcoidales bacterium]